MLRRMEAYDESVVEANGMDVADAAAAVVVDDS
jgi:hypothetical protein